MLGGGVYRTCSARKLGSQVSGSLLHGVPDHPDAALRARPRLATISITPTDEIRMPNIVHHASQGSPGTTVSLARLDEQENYTTQQQITR